MSPPKKGVKTAPEQAGDLLTRTGVGQAMRRQIASLPAHARLDQAVRMLVKFKMSALLVTGDTGRARGVVSKTDLMTAFYGDFSLDTPVDQIMVSPPATCRRSDSLDEALEVMRQARIHRLYVTDKDGLRVVGVLAYPDIVGLIYRICHNCEKSVFGRNSADAQGDVGRRLRVRQVMSPGVQACLETDSLTLVMEGLSQSGPGAMLIVDDNDRPAGVVSKTDLIMAYMHGLPAGVQAKEVMTTPVRLCDHNQPLIEALKQMIIPDVHRLFVHGDDPQEIIGVLSLSDAVRFRSGSCRACLSARIEINQSLA